MTARLFEDSVWLPLMYTGECVLEYDVDFCRKNSQLLGSIPEKEGDPVQYVVGAIENRVHGLIAREIRKLPVESIRRTMAVVACSGWMQRFLKETRVVCRYVPMVESWLHARFVVACRHVDPNWRKEWFSWFKEPAEEFSVEFTWYCIDLLPGELGLEAIAMTELPPPGRYMKEADLPTVEEWMDTNYNGRSIA